MGIRSPSLADGMGVRGRSSLDALAGRRDVEVLSLSAISQDESPAVRIVNSTLYDALKEGASDVHLKRSARGMMIKYRINGVLSPVKNIDGVDLAGQMISLIKDSAIVSVISIQELTYQGTQLMASTYLTIEVWLTIAALYFLLTFPCSLAVDRMDRRLNRGR